MGPLALLGLLAAAALAGVSTAPVAKEQLEELVTECIVEVLSNALSKPDAPPINPDCKEILKKGGRNDRERSENNQPEVRHLKDTAETAKHLPGSMEEEHRQSEEEGKESMKGSDQKKLAQEEDKSKEEETGHHAAAEEEELHREEKKHYQEIREEKSYQSEEESQDSQGRAKEVELAVLNKKSPSEGMSTEELPAGGEQRPTGRWRSGEARQSPYKRVPEGEEGEAEGGRSEKPHQESKEGDFSHQQQRAEAEESEEMEEKKPPYNPRRYGKQRVGDSSEEERGPGGEEEESKTEESHLWDKRNQHQKQQEASQQQREEESGSYRRHGSEEVEERRRAGQGAEEYRERWWQSEESSEEETHRQREDSDERWQEERRPRDGAQEGWRHGSEGRTHLGGESRQELDRYLGGGSKEKQQGGSSRGASEEEGLQKAFGGERRAEARTQHSTGESAEQLRYLGNGREQEEVEKQHQSNEQMEDEEEDVEEGRYAEREGYRSRFPAESKKRTAAAYSQLYPLLWWKSRHLEKREGTGEQLLEGKEEGRPGLAEQRLFPEYDYYEWWEKQQRPQGALRQGHPQQKSPSIGSRVPAKRQHKVEQLAQLLSYTKKAAEFPELYTSREDARRRQASRSDRSLSQRPLTEEEEKELEHLAAMELELQKIAQKFKDKRRG